jgi:hypothetical protein
MKTKFLTALALSMAAVSMSAAAAAASPNEYGAKTRCLYDSVEGSTSTNWVMRIARIEVTPPTVSAHQGGRQFVGWRFIVERNLDYGGWVERFRSTIQIAIATQTDAADFSRRGVDVHIPQFVIDDVSTPNYHDLDYRVSLKIFWYDGDGTKAEVVSTSPVEYRLYKDGEFLVNYPTSCYYAWANG